jgi:hypothetical protein
MLQRKHTGPWDKPTGESSKFLPLKLPLLVAWRIGAGCTLALLGCFPHRPVGVEQFVAQGISTGTLIRWRRNKKAPAGTDADLCKQVYAALIFRLIFLAAAVVFAC